MSLYSGNESFYALEITLHGLFLRDLYLQSTNEYLCKVCPFGTFCSYGGDYKPSAECDPLPVITITQDDLPNLQSILGRNANQDTFHESMNVFGWAVMNRALCTRLANKANRFRSINSQVNPISKAKYDSDLGFNNMRNSRPDLY